MLASVQYGRIDSFCELAREIWLEYYPPIIGLEQTKYMLKTFHSPEAIIKSMNEGYRFYLILCDSREAGYLCFKKQENSLFLSKLYLRKEFRGRGLAKDSIQKLCGICRLSGLPAIELTVNKNNHSSIAAYTALGFTELRHQATDIGGGFVMDDFVLTLKV